MNRKQSLFILGIVAFALVILGIFSFLYISDLKNPISHRNFSKIYSKLKREFPDSRLVIIVDHHGKNNEGDKSQVTFASHSTENNKEPPVYYASLIKPLYAAVAAERATALNIDSSKPIIPLILTPSFSRELYADFVKNNNHLGSDKTGYPFVSRMVVPHINLVQLQPLIDILHERQRTERQTDPKEVTKAYAKIKDPQTKIVGQALIIGFTELLSDKKLEEEIRIDSDKFFAQSKPLANVSLGEIIHAAVGPSSNYAVERMVDFIKANLPGDVDSAQNYVQKKVDEILGRSTSLTINNTRKEKATGFWNAGKLSELLTIYQGIFDNSKDWKMSKEFHSIILTSMQKEDSDENTAMRNYFTTHILLSDLPISKSGYFFNLDLKPNKTNSMPQLIKDNGWSQNSESFITYILTMERYKNIDYALAIGIPHDYIYETDLKEQKETASRIVFSELSKLLEKATNK